jgi:uracil-DNA glycosylase
MENRDRLRSVVLDRLESLSRAGVMQLPKAQQHSAMPTTIEPPRPATAIVVHEPMAPSHPQKVDHLEDRTVPKSPQQFTGTTTLLAASDARSPEAPQAPSLAVLQQEVAACTRCDELASKRTQTVFGVGNPQARLCFMGEAPGADEDRLGEPFVGRAGQLLTKIIEACQMKREDAYILNMIKCRPPGNRNPLPDELANCRGFLERQLELIRPEFICCLGAVAAQNLLNTTIPIGKLRGKLHAYHGIKVVCTFHPAYLLRNPSAKKDAWDDMKFLLHEMGFEL